MTDETIKVRFLRNYTVQDAKGASYEEGQEERFNPASANHFVRRGVAEVVTGQPAAKKPEKEPAKTTKKTTKKTKGK